MRNCFGVSRADKQTERKRVKITPEFIRELFCISDLVPTNKQNFFFWDQVRKINENFFKKFAFFRRIFSISGKYIL